LHVQTNGQQPGMQTECAFWPTATGWALV